VVVLGHSNTVPLLLNILTGTDDFSNLPETQYDNLFIVSVFEKGRSKVVHLKYGKPTP
jgi:2,3-bisphosphoglycerate-dependent phosphoglycerate mutase